jgi:hypothetical protein
LERQISPEKYSEGVNESNKLRQREQKWIEENQNEYAGQWVVLDGNVLLIPFTLKNHARGWQKRDRQGACSVRLRHAP